eukprot:scaffold20745_cov88-Cylindrotheca_fusiformis.AAC.1
MTQRTEHATIGKPMNRCHAEMAQSPVPPQKFLLCWREILIILMRHTRKQRGIEVLCCGINIMESCHSGK